MEKQRFSTKELARLMEISPQAINKLLRSESGSLSAFNTVKAARIMSINADWLASGEGEMGGPKYGPAQSGGSAEQPTLHNALRVFHSHVIAVDDEVRKRVLKCLEVYISEPERLVMMLGILQDLLTAKDVKEVFKKP